jgi:hypothetical protein
MSRVRLPATGPMPTRVISTRTKPAWPVPVALIALSVVHILGAAVYAVGAFQFLPSLRRRHLVWHRRAGRVLAVAGLLVAGSAHMTSAPTEPG